MIARPVRRQVLLTTTMLVGALAGYARSAYGQQVCLQQGVTTTFLCDGSSGDTQDLTFATTGVNNIDVIMGASFDVDTVAGTGGNAITITGDGAISYLDYNASPLTADDTALHMEATGDDGGTPGSVTLNTNGVLQGDIGIDARNHGSGTLTITANGNVTGSSEAGIYALNYGGDLAVSTGSATTVEGGLFGVQALNFGSGALTITVGGDVAGTIANGIAATSLYSVTVTTDNSTTVSGVDGIGVSTYYGSATITANGNVTGDQYGINTRVVYGSGTLAIIVNGTVTSNGLPLFPFLSSDGIYAQHFGSGPITVTVGAASTVISNGAGADDFAIDIVGNSGNVTVAGTLNGGAGGAIQFDEVAVLADRLKLHPTASINGNVFAGPGTDTLAFGGTSDGAFNLANIDTQYQDFETFEVDSGTWTFSGTTTVPFSVNGGTMMGTGTFGGLTVNNGGVLAPGNSIGTMTVNGSFTLNPGASLLVSWGRPRTLRHKTIN